MSGLSDYELRAARNSRKRLRLFELKWLLMENLESHVLAVEVRSKEFAMHRMKLTIVRLAKPAGSYWQIERCRDC